MLPTFPIRLSFDPSKSEKLAPILASPTAWKLWLLWKPRHLTNQWFDEECLDIAADIDKEKPSTPQELRKCFGLLRSSVSNFPSRDCDEFCPLAFPYLVGSEPIETLITPH